MQLQLIKYFEALFNSYLCQGKNCFREWLKRKKVSKYFQISFNSNPNLQLFIILEMKFIV
jgi:hypothetical protein